MPQSQYSVVVFGATSFVGQILCRYLVDTFGANLRWAAAGRSLPKLEALRRELGPQAADLPLLVADASDPASLAELCRAARVVVSTVGPYALYGEPLVKECVKQGVDYCDLTGEPQWIARMIRAYEPTARMTGARIVHCCGFDSIPSDLGVYFLQQQARARLGQPCTRVKLRIKALKGGASGGTVASMVNIMQEAVRDPALRAELANPYSLCPPGHAFKTRQPNVSRATYDADFKAWLAPFVMAAINTRVVHRSNALSSNSYGLQFVYDEAMITRGWLKAHAVAWGTLAFLAATTAAPLRWLMEQTVLPKPGEGPTPAEQASGFFDFRFLGTTADGQSLRVKVTGDRDPGYGSTAKMLGQAAACLAEDVPKSDVGGGFWTPSTIFGAKVIARLQEHAGVQFSVLN